MTMSSDVGFTSMVADYAEIMGGSLFFMYYDTSCCTDDTYHDTPCRFMIRVVIRIVFNSMDDESSVNSSH